ncbi:MAG: hypothetical protein COX62_04545 [Deltaproteobacteria bacterium CG_4_10_14_0_2_um_filter_43_8]|nr:MAG: hypothetical protein COV43_04590 [Deltaproteobacteria bacterium CG11_big_fil_rev_8_21_14_0_20_42_23]PJA20514.1 MAG: hypothetical protein COX62_04545 [Deltaproteobacteria bacterium CG_4_10_14_0_2_um_filter_43_8]PJC65053.1 MAG: hypothetical protein CO021_00980 [Deltaproteobacteria bacterium CG_4_9_14_0_2_um_filter_42_21]
MSKRFHNLALDQSREDEDQVTFATLTLLEGGKTPPGSDLAKRCLNSFPVSQFSCDLKVSDRTIQKWKSGQEPIPENRKLQIVGITKSYFISDLNQLEDEIDRMLMNQYGPNVDGGTY